MDTAANIDHNAKQSIVFPMILAGSMFFILGCITWLNGAITPFLQQMLELSPLQASFIISSFFISTCAYFCFMLVNLMGFPLKTCSHVILRAMGRT